MDSKQIDNTFSYHTPKEVPGKLPQAERYEAIRELAKNLAHYINEACPDSTDKDEALKRLKEAVMWANVSIANNE